ncbi:MAG: hypothetical protein ACP5LW_06505 [Nitrososphaeria archaeon]
MGFDISEMMIFVVRTKRDLSEEVKGIMLRSTIFHINAHSEHELEKIMPLKLFEIKYDRDFVVRKASWVLDYWLQKRDPVPAKMASKCRSCEYNKRCPFSLA